MRPHTNESPAESARASGFWGAMKTYYLTTVGKKTTHTDIWRAAKCLANHARKAGTYPIEVEQCTRIDGRSPHRRKHVCIESADDESAIEKRDSQWECIDSFYSHIKPSRNL